MLPLLSETFLCITIKPNGRSPHLCFDTSRYSPLDCGLPLQDGIRLSSHESTDFQSKPLRKKQILGILILGSTIMVISNPKGEASQTAHRGNDACADQFTWDCDDDVPTTDWIPICRSRGINANTRPRPRLLEPPSENATTDHAQAERQIWVSENCLHVLATPRLTAIDSSTTSYKSLSSSSVGRCPLWW